MGVLIKGMEMPASCRECRLKMNCDDCEGWECVCVPLHQQIGYLDDLLADKRRDDCPLVPVPPHGRLIDADALRAKMYHEAFETDSPMQKWDSGCWIRYKMFERMEEAAPTIIPAAEATQKDGGQDDV